MQPLREMFGSVPDDAWTLLTGWIPDTLKGPARGVSVAVADRGLAVPCCVCWSLPGRPPPVVLHRM
jgi:hypothetical protein